MKTVKILSIKNIAKSEKFLVQTYDGEQIWLGYAAFKNAAGSLNISEFVGGEITFEYLKKGDTLADGTEVTDDNKLVNQLTVAITANDLISARKAAILAEMEQEKMEESIAKRRARYASMNRTDENQDEQPGEQTQPGEAQTAGATASANQGGMGV